MNSYKHQYLIMNLDDKVFQQIQEKLLTHTNHQKSKTENFDGENFSPDEDDPTRKSKGCFVDDEDIYNIIWELADQVNCHSFWNFEIDKIESLQHTLYEEGGFYDWHIDESQWTPFKRDESRIRKISFTLLLNEDFDGGEFKILTDREMLIPMRKGDIIFFHSDMPHKVTKVRSGNRKSLVGWIQGPAFK